MPNHNPTPFAVIRIYPPVNSFPLSAEDMRIAAREDASEIREALNRALAEMSEK